jgi:chromosome segregation ATPase
MSNQRRGERYDNRRNTPHPQPYNQTYPPESDGQWSLEQQNASLQAHLYQRNQELATSQYYVAEARQRADHFLASMNAALQEKESLHRTMEELHQSLADAKNQIAILTRTSEEVKARNKADVSSTTKSVEQLQAELLSTRAKIQQLSSEKALIMQKLETSEAQLAKMKLQYVKEYEAAQSLSMQLEKHGSSCVSKSNALEEQLNHQASEYAKQVAQYEAEIEALNAKLANATEPIPLFPDAAMESLYEQECEKVRALMAQLDEIRQVSTALQDKVALLEKENRSHETYISSSKALMAESIETYENRIQELRGQIDNHVQGAKNLKESTAAQIAELTLTYEKQIKDLKEQVANREGTEKNLKEKLATANKSLDALQSHYEFRASIDQSTIDKLQSEANNLGIDLEVETGKCKSMEAELCLLQEKNALMKNQLEEALKMLESDVQNQKVAETAPSFDDCTTSSTSMDYSPFLQMEEMKKKYEAMLDEQRREYDCFAEEMTQRAQQEAEQSRSTIAHLQQVIGCYMSELAKIKDPKSETPQAYDPFETLPSQDTEKTITTTKKRQLSQVLQHQDDVVEFEPKRKLPSRRAKLPSSRKAKLASMRLE